MSFTMNLHVPNKIVPKVRVLPDQKIRILNSISLFSQKNKMIFISKGIVLPYNKSMKECNLSEGDHVFALNINDNYFLENMLNTKEEVNIALLKNNVPIFGPCFEANLTSINKIIMISLSQDIPMKKISIRNKLSLDSIARVCDIRLMRKENSRKSWRNQLFSYLNKETNDYHCHEITNIEYDPPKEPSCEAFPIIL